MTIWDYRVTAAPKRGIKVKGAKTGEDRFAAALEEVMNQLGAEGWEYVRSDTLPVEERQGLTGRTTTYQTLLVFRRPRAEPAAVDATPRIQRPVAAPIAAPPVAAPEPAAPPLLGPAEPRD